MNNPQKAIHNLGLLGIMFVASHAVYGQTAFRITPPTSAKTSTDLSRQIQVKLLDGTSIPVDEAWESEQGVWYRQSGMSHLITRDRIKAIERTSSLDKQEKAQPAKPNAVVTTGVSSGSAVDQPVWIFLVGGARVEADSATESPEGVWYRRGSLTVFLDRTRVDHVERESPEPLADSGSHAKQERGWTTGNKQLDGLIRQNGMKYGVDPYLIFCVMEQESHFNYRALSPKGARGLMQLMPGTAARFGVRRASDPAQNIAGGTRYLKQLIEQFEGRVDLVLASYNAGEGAVLKFGRRVPPYRETRDYVKKISYRYRRNRSSVFSKGELVAPGIRAGT